MNKTPTLEEVRKFAIDAHGDQTYGAGVPYQVHLDTVVVILDEFGVFPQDEEVRMVGYLHDVVEDTPTTLEDLQEFGLSESIRDAVDFCTDEEGQNRKTRKANTIRKWTETIEWEGLKTGWVMQAIVVKLADRIANLRQSHLNNPSLLKMYRKEAEVFRAALITPALPWLPKAMWEEYDKLVKP